ncbi:roadblock/LC7 domain-containing protein [Thermodesulfobacteriota bacterium]
MAAEEVVVQDIFEGAERVEILGKLPFVLWEYIDLGHKLIQNVAAGTDEFTGSLERLSKILELLETAAALLENESLKSHLGRHGKILSAIGKNDISNDQFQSSFHAELSKLQEMAGPKPDTAGEGLLPKDFLDKELDKAERVKSGRSLDLIVSVEILDEIRNYLTGEILTEGISTIMVIDNAGSLISNVGAKLELDVVSLAAVAAANFAATEKIARLIGERDFTLLFYKGHNESFHFSRVGTEYIVVTIFSNTLSLGLLRLKIAEVAQVLEQKLPKREE